MKRFCCCRMLIVLVLSLGSTLALGAPLADVPPDATPAQTNAAPDLAHDLRLYYVRPRVFEYLFTGAGTGASSNSAPLLFFRDLAGNTPAVRIYEPLGPYTVTGFTPRKVRVFKESIHATVEEDASTVTLRDNTGSNRVLTVGKPLTEPGLMGCLVSTVSGGWGNVRAGDALDIEDMDVTITGLTTTSATLRANTQDFVIQLATDEERKTVMGIWETRRREAEAQQARAKALAEEKRQQAASAAAAAEAARVPTAVATATWPPPQPTRSSPAGSFFYGTEIHYPTVYETVPYNYVYPNGQIYTREILGPSCFEYRHGRHNRRWH